MQPFRKRHSGALSHTSASLVLDCFSDRNCSWSIVCSKIKSPCNVFNLLSWLTHPDSSQPLLDPMSHSEDVFLSFWTPLSRLKKKKKKPEKVPKCKMGSLRVFSLLHLLSLYVAGWKRLCLREMIIRRWHIC